MKRSALKPGKPLQRSSYLRRVSKKRATEQRSYSALRREFLAENLWCHVCLDVGGPWTTGTICRATDVHHMRGRVGADYLDVRHWLPVCRNHHDLIGAQPLVALARGYSLSRIAKAST